MVASKSDQTSPFWCRSQGTASRQLKRWSWWLFLWGFPWMAVFQNLLKMKMIRFITESSVDTDLRSIVLTQNWLGSRPHRSCASPGSGCWQKECASCKMEWLLHDLTHKKICHATCLKRSKPVYNKWVSVVPRLFETNKLCKARLPFTPSCQNAWVLGCILTGATLRRTVLHRGQAWND